MKKLFISGMILFFCVFFVSCSGGTTPPLTFPDDGGMGSYDPQFISLLNELYSPNKLAVYLIQNTQYKEHDGIYTPYEFYLRKEGDCADYSVFSCYVLHYHDRIAYSVIMLFSDVEYGHAITVFESKKDIDDSLGWAPNMGKYSYFTTYRYIIPAGTNPGGFDTIKDCVDHYMEHWGSKHTLASYEVNPWNYFYYKQ